MDPKVTDSTGPRLIDHQYDGIQEYDNPMPRWWLGTFYVTIVFSAVYLFNIGPIGIGPGRIGEYDAAVARAAAEHPPTPPGGDSSPSELAALVNNPAAVAEGKQLFATNCAACHAADGGGNIGPNLTDAYWLHGGAIDAMYKTVRLGVMAKGMPGWEKLLKPSQLDRVVAFVYSLRGTTPAKPKAPEGVLDSTTVSAGGQ